MWRDQEDYHIDWNLSAEEIKRFIYAVGHPFEGAFSIIKGEKIRIVDCELIQDLKIENRTVGKVFSLTKNQPVIVAKNGLIKITNATDDSGNPYKFDILKTRLQ
jgi:methionyl-tRNA formyltransferase